MTNAQKIFCDEYLIDMNGSRAYKKAYPNVKKDESARVNASKLLTKANIKLYIEERMAEKEAELIATQDEVLKYLTSVLRGESESEIVVIEGDGDGYSSARTMKKTPDEKERLKAGELLGKRYGLFVDKSEIETKVTEYRIGFDD